jgi:hypothetical protein
LTTVFFIIACLSIIGFLFFWIRRKETASIKDVDFDFETHENSNEPIISYSVYTVDTKLNQRFLNYAHNHFPHHFGILKHQQIELDWNVLNADFISIEGVGLVKAVGRKTFYPTANTKYIIRAKNKEYDIQQEIFIRVFPVHVADNLAAKIPFIQIKNDIQIPTMNIIVTEAIDIPKPNITASKPDLILLNDALNMHKEKLFSFTKLINYFKQKKADS